MRVRPVQGAQVKGRCVDASHCVGCTRVRLRPLPLPRPLLPRPTARPAAASAAARTTSSASASKQEPPKGFHTSPPLTLLTSAYSCWLTREGPVSGLLLDSLEVFNMPCHIALQEPWSRISGWNHNSPCNFGGPSCCHCRRRLQLTRRLPLRTASTGHLLDL